MIETAMEPIQAAVQTAMMTADEARAAAGRIRFSVGDLRRMLLEFESRRGYAALGYQNMRLCAEHEFGWPKSQFYRQLKAIDVERSVGVAIGDMPESHARELAKLPAAERAEAYAAAGDGATAAEVRREVDRRRAGCKPETPLPEVLPPETDEEEAPLCHGCGEPVPGGIEDGLPVLCDRCGPHYGEPIEEEAAATPDSVGGSEATDAPGRPVCGDSVGFSAPGHSQDPPEQETASIPEGEEEWLIAVLERGWLLENGLPMPRLVKLARIVVARAADSTRAGMVARAFLGEARG